MTRQDKQDKNGYLPLPTRLVPKIHLDERGKNMRLIHRRLLRAVALIGLIASLSILPGGSIASSPGTLRFVPLIHVGLHVPSSVITSHGGVLPDLKIHYYVPSDITAAYGVDAVHAAGITGAGQTI